MARRWENLLASLSASLWKRSAATVASALLLFPSISWPAGLRAVKVVSEVPATADATQGHEGYNSPSLAFSPKFSEFAALAVRLDGSDFGCGLQVSGNGGHDWAPANPVPKLPPGAEKCYAPEVSIGPDGSLYYLFVGLHTAGNTPMGAFITRSTDMGKTFSHPRKILGPNSFQVRMAIDHGAGSRGRIHVIWLKALEPPGLGSLPARPNPILAFHSDDGGETFSKPVQVSDRRRERVVAPSLAIGGEGEVNVLYYDLAEDRLDYHGLEGPPWEGSWELVFSRSRDGGQRFSRGVIVDRVVPPGRVPLIFTMPPPSLAVGEGRTFAAWTDARAGDPDIWLSRSLDDGRSWDKARRLNDDLKGNGRTQELSRLSLSENGRLDAVFFDRRNDPANVKNDVFYAVSGDKGVTFSRNVRINSESFDSRVGRRYEHPAAKGLAEFGSRLGLASLEEWAVAAWTDTRNATHFLDQHVFTAKIAVTPQRGFPVKGSLAVLVSLGLAIGFVRLLKARSGGGSSRREGV